jgi:hypothetical protein
MAEQQTCTLYYTVVATGNLTRGCGIGWDGALPAAGASIQGIANTNIATGFVGQCNVGPTSIAIAGAVLTTANLELQVDAQGRFIPKAAGKTVAMLKAGQTAAAAGELIEVIPVIAP